MITWLIVSTVISTLHVLACRWWYRRGFRHGKLARPIIIENPLPRFRPTDALVEWEYPEITVE